MDFGDILNQWDELCSKEEKVQKDKIRETNKPRPRLPNAPSLSGNQAVSKKDASFQDFEKTGGQGAQEDSLPRVNPMDLWLRRYGVMITGIRKRESSIFSLLWSRATLLQNKPYAR